MLKELMYELCRGLAYRRIQHPEMRLYTTKLPIVVYLVIMTVYLLLPIQPSWAGKDGLLNGVLSIFATLPGFYFAGLAAVATFGSTNMDTEMPEPTPKIDMRIMGNPLPVPLSKRQFLAYLFSYLVVLSFGICFFILGMNSLIDNITLLKSYILNIQAGFWIWEILKFVVISFIVLVSASMAVTTLHGIYFLTEKMHN